MRSILGAILSCAPLLAMAWSPPPNPDPRAILDEATADRMQGRYEDALAKHLWFHREAARIEPALVGVRGSFALGYWSSLAMKYPPAMAALVTTRDAAEAQVRANDDVRNAFHDLAAINRELDEQART